MHIIGRLWFLIIFTFLFNFSIIMAVSESYKEFIDDQLAGIEGVYAKKMFGGVGYFVDGVIFGCIMGGVFRLKTNEQTEKKYTELGLSGYNVPGKNMTMPYFEVPESILENPNELKKWSLEALEISRNNKKK